MGYVMFLPCARVCRISVGKVGLLSDLGRLTRIKGLVCFENLRFSSWETVDGLWAFWQPCGLVASMTDSAF